MNRLVREKLRDLVAADTALLRNAGRMRNQLLEAVPGASREIAALSAAVEENVPPSITRATGSLSVQGSLDRTARSLAENRALSLSAATWAVRSWAWALHRGPEPDDPAGDHPDGSVTPMRAAPRQTLREILTRYGPEIQHNPSLLRALLSDLVPGYRREQAALVAAAEEGVPASVSAATVPTGAPPADRLIQAQALNPDAANWAVASWAWALDRGPEPHDVATATGPDAPASVPPFTPSPAPPQRPPVSPHLVSRGRATPPPPSPVATPGWRDGHEFVSPADLEKPPRRGRGRMVAIIVAVLAVLGIGTGVAIAANQNNDDSYSSSGPAAEPAVTTPDDTQTTPEDSGQNSVWQQRMQKYFWLPDDCREVTPDADGAEYSITCQTDTDAKGNTTGVAVAVTYTGWSSVDEMDDYLNAAKKSTDLAEQTWYFDSDPSLSMGRFITFSYDDGSAGLDWSYTDRLVTGEAQATCTEDQLKQWWASGVDRE